MKVLIIEDNVIWQLKVQIMIEELGYKVSKHCSTSFEVIQYLNEEQPDLIVADIVLKNEVIFVLSSVFEKQKIPCIFMTATITESNYEQVKAFAKTRFLVKPFNIVALQSTIDSLNITQSINEKSNGIFVTGKLRQKILIPFEEILYIEAEGNYSTINTVNQKKYVIKKALAQISSELSLKFVKIQRALFINSDFINRVDFSQEELNLSGKSIKIGRKYRTVLATYINYKS